MHCTEAVYRYNVTRSVVCVLGTPVRPAKTAEPRSHFLGGGMTRTSPRNHKRESMNEMGNKICL